MSDSAAVLTTTVLVALSFAVPAIALLRARRARAAASLMILTAAVLFAAGVLEVAGADRGARTAGVLVGLLLGPLCLVLYPRARWSHPVDYLTIVTVLAAGVLAVTAPATTTAMALAVLLVVPGHLWWRLEHARGGTRRALTWMALSAGSATLVAGVLSFAVPPSQEATWSLLPFVVVGPALYVGVTRSHLTDARTLVVPVASHLTTAITFVAVFVGVAALLVDGAPDAATVPVLGLLAAVLAPAYHPTEQLLRGVVEELLFGHRPDPLQAVGLVSSHSGDDPEEALRAVREALALPWAAVLDGDRTVLASGHRPQAVARLPLGEEAGDLEVGLRGDEVTLTTSEQRVLALVTPLLAQTLRLRTLATELQDSREQTVAAVEDERLRLRRDLHDGLGPTLSGIAFTSDAARNLLRTEPARAEELLDELRRQTGAALDDVRRIVYAMRPPALDELGLVPAVRQATTGLQNTEGTQLRVTCTAQGPLELPAAVEVAAFRIAVEAVRNTAGHSSAGAVTVRLEVLDGALHVDVRDDGAQTPEWSRGVGLSSMRERAEELGGTLRAGPTPEGGRVQAALPLVRARAGSSSTASSS